MITIPLVVLLGAAVFFMWRYSPLTTTALVVVALFGFLLAGTSWGKPIRDGVSSARQFVNRAAGKAGS